MTGSAAVLDVHSYIEVADLERGIAFYCDGLGLTLKRRLGPNWIELDGANLPIFLLGNRPLVAELGDIQAERNFARHWTPVHLDFVVADLDAVVTRLTGLGASLDRAIQQAEYGRMANMADPFGNGFDLIEFSGAGYDAVSR
jgi:predicted enzyme related to lactoylglutathione lyase